MAQAQSTGSGFSLNSLFPKLTSLGSLPISGDGGNAAPSYAGGNTGSMFGLDGSNWNVSFGSGDISSDAEKNSASGISQYLPWLMVAVGGVLVWRYMNKR